MAKRISAKNIKIKRAYAKPVAEDGLRILIDRLWPRGLTKNKAAIDHWFKEIAPSTKLRKWFSHDPEKWHEFKKRYRAELKSSPEAWKSILEAARDGEVTLLYSASDTEHNSALVLKALLARISPGSSRAPLERSTFVRTTFGLLWRGFCPSRQSGR